MAEIDKTLIILKKLREKFDPHLSESLRDSQFFVDLADIHEICLFYIEAIDSITKKEFNLNHVTDTLYDMDIQLFEHLPNHTKSLKNLLPKVIDQLERETQPDQEQ